ncbi:MAG: insulinase family protein [Kofleriaceae bacterium]|nr:insulinase family protein [Kofleriaceae bacterium]
MAVRRALVTSLVLIGACSLTPRPPPAPPRTTSIGLAISTSTLANGLRVVLVRDPAASEVQVTMRYEVGAVEDGAHAGLAHLVEHLMFQQEVDGKALFTQLESVASYFNATTALDATTYIARAPRAQLTTLLAIEAARAELRCTTITDAVFTREREVVINEVKQRDQTTEVFAAIHRELYPEGHPYRQPIGGSVESVAAIAREDACRFTDAYYAPNKAVLVVSGNVTEEELAASLGRLARVPRRDVVAQSLVDAITPPPHHVEVPVPIDRDVFVLAWPLPLDPALQAKVRAIAAAIPRLADSQIKGTVSSVDFGDRRAPMLGIAVMPGEGESLHDAVQGTRRAIDALPGVFRENQASWVDAVVFDRIKQGAIYGLYASLDDGGDRDMKLASYVAAGVEPNLALATELDALRSMTREEGARLAATYLAGSRPTGITLRAAALVKRGDPLRLDPPVHELGAPRIAETTREATDLRTRVLPNGLTVVLAPTSSVPTFEARLVFRTGTGDEPANQRGVAMLAAHTLTWDLHYLDDLIPFIRAGALRNTDVTTDRTTFSVQGLDMNLDVVLAGLRRWVREGTYDDSAAGFVRTMRQAAKRFDDQGVLTDAWRTALYGPEHPYVRAGLARHANNTVTQQDAARFRATNYAPGNATLVLAGRFDPVLAERWVDYLFADWQGPAPARRSLPSTPSAASIARIEDIAMVQLRVALPAGPQPRAQQLVAAAMLASIAHDVRFQLGASYTFDAQLQEARLVNFYMLGGWVDAARASDAVRLVRDRIAELRANPEVAARAFTSARTHVLAQLRSRVGSASSIAARVERDIELVRPPMADLDTARDVEALASADLADTIATLDLARATVLMSGPPKELEQAFALLDRTPVYLQAPSAPDSGPGATAPAFVMQPQRVRLSDVEPSLTEQPPSALSFTVTLGHTWANELSGYALGAGVAYRHWRNLAYGGYLQLANLEGRTPVELAGFVQLDSRRHGGWVQPLLGLLADHGAAPLAGLQVGWDFLQRGPHQFGVAVRGSRSLLIDDVYSAVSLAVTYRY